MKILFLGPDAGTSRHRFLGLARLKHQARLIDPRRLLPRSAFVDRFAWRIHPAPLAAIVRSSLGRALDGEQYDLAFVDGGSLVSPGLVRDLQARGMKVVNFNHDDPFGGRDAQYFTLYCAAVPHYDLVVVVRKENVAEATALGARRVLHTFRVADDVAHAPLPLSPEMAELWRSDVSFIGTWMPERGPILARLLSLGVPLSIFGGLWHKAPEWPMLRKAHRAGSLEAEEYRYAVQASKICIGLLSKENRDRHTTRSLEIPSLGSLFCAQRTTDHESLYADRREAVFWTSPEECAALCLDLLADEPRRATIAAQGRARFIANGHTTDRLLTRIIDETFA